MTLDTLYKAWCRYDDAYKAETAEFALTGSVRSVTHESTDKAMIHYTTLSTDIMRQYPQVWDAFVQKVNQTRYIPKVMH